MASALRSGLRGLYHGIIFRLTSGCSAVASVLRSGRRGLYYGIIFRLTSGCSAVASAQWLARFVRDPECNPTVLKYDVWQFLICGLYRPVPYALSGCLILRAYVSYGPTRTSGCSCCHCPRRRRYRRIPPIHHSLHCTSLSPASMWPLTASGSENWPWYSRTADPGVVGSNPARRAKPSHGKRPPDYFGGLWIWILLASQYASQSKVC